jgi:hypothetical protein
MAVGTAVLMFGTLIKAVNAQKVGLRVKFPPRNT